MVCKVFNDFVIHKICINIIYQFFCYQTKISHTSFIYLYIVVYFNVCLVSIHLKFLVIRTFFSLRVLFWIIYFFQCFSMLIYIFSFQLTGFPLQDSPLCNLTLNTVRSYIKNNTHYVYALLSMLCTYFKPVCWTN